MVGGSLGGSEGQKGSNPPIGTKGAAEWYWKRYTELCPKYLWADDTKLADIVVVSAKGSLLYEVEGLLEKARRDGRRASETRPLV